MSPNEAIKEARAKLNRFARLIDEFEALDFPDASDAKKFEDAVLQPFMPHADICPECILYKVPQDDYSYWFYYNGEEYIASPLMTTIDALETQLSAPMSLPFVWVIYTISTDWLCVKGVVVDTDMKECNGSFVPTSWIDCIKKDTLICTSLHD